MFTLDEFSFAELKDEFEEILDISILHPHTYKKKNKDRVLIKHEKN